MINIHGFSESQFESLRSKTKEEFPHVVARSLANAKVLGNRIIHFFRKCEWVTDKKLANWAITEFEKFDSTNDDPAYRLTILKVDALCAKALLAASKNLTLYGKHNVLPKKLFPAGANPVSSAPQNGGVPPEVEEDAPSEGSFSSEDSDSSTDTGESDEGQSFEEGRGSTGGREQHSGDAQSSSEWKKATPTNRQARFFVGGARRFSSPSSSDVSDVPFDENPVTEELRQSTLNECPSTQTRIEEEDRFKGKGSAEDSDTSGTDTDESDEEKESSLSRSDQGRNRPIKKEDLDSVGIGFNAQIDQAIIFPQNALFEQLMIEVQTEVSNPLFDSYDREQISQFLLHVLQLPDISSQSFSSEELNRWTNLRRFVFAKVKLEDALDFLNENSEFKSVFRDLHPEYRNHVQFRDSLLSGPISTSTEPMQMSGELPNIHRQVEAREVSLLENFFELLSSFPRDKTKIEVLLEGRAAEQLGNLENNKYHEIYQILMDLKGISKARRKYIIQQFTKIFGRRTKERTTNHNHPHKYVIEQFSKTLKGKEKVGNDEEDLVVGSLRRRVKKPLRRPKHKRLASKRKVSSGKGKEKADSNEKDLVSMPPIVEGRSSNRFVYRETDEVRKALEDNFSKTLIEMIDRGAGLQLHERFKKSFPEKEFAFNANEEGITEIPDPEALATIVKLAKKSFPAVFKNAKTEKDRCLVARLIQIGLTGQGNSFSAVSPATPFLFAIKIPPSTRPLSFETVSFLEFFAKGLGVTSFDKKFIHEEFGFLFIRDFIQASTIIEIDGKEYSYEKKNLSEAIEWIAKHTANKYKNNPEEVARKLEEYRKSPFFKHLMHLPLPFFEMLLPPENLDNDQKHTIADLAIAAEIKEHVANEQMDSMQLSNLHKLTQLKLVEKVIVLNQKTLLMFFESLQAGYSGSHLFPAATESKFVLGSEDSDSVGILIRYSVKNLENGEIQMYSSLSAVIPNLESPIKATEISINSNKMLLSWESDPESIAKFSCAEMYNTIQKLGELVREKSTNLPLIQSCIGQFHLDLGQFELLKIKEINNAEQLMVTLQLAYAIINVALSAENEEEVISELGDIRNLLESQIRYVSQYLDLNSEWVELGNEASPEEVPKRTFYSSFLEVVKKTATDIPILGQIRNWNESDNPVVNRVKSGKYENLLQTLRSSLERFDTLKNRLAQDGIAELAMNARIMGHLSKIHEATQKINLNSRDLDYLTLIRDAYELEALSALREAIKLCETYQSVDEELQNFTYNIAYSLYTSNKMDLASDELLNMLKTYEGAVPYQESPTSKSPVIGKLRHTLKTIKNAPQELTTSSLNRIAKSVKDHVGFNFSPIEAGNPPQFMEKLTLHRGNSEDQPITIIGMGSPTIQRSTEAIFNYEAEIDPIFRAYLHVLESRNLPHLYISLQDARGKSAEKLRNKPIMALQDDPAFEKSFFAITFSKNSHFYEGEGSEWVSTFKQELHDQFFKYSVEESGCSIPKKVQDQILAKTGISLGEVSKIMIDNIEKIIGRDSMMISEHERKLFIELYYNLLTTYIASNLDIRIMNFTCKDGIDRGMGALAWFEFMWMIVNDLENEEQSFKTLDMIVNTRAYWVRKRAIVEARGERFFDDATLLLEKIALPETRKGFKALLKSIIPDVVASELESSKT